MKKIIEGDELRSRLEWCEREAEAWKCFTDVFYIICIFAWILIIIFLIFGV